MSLLLLSGVAHASGGGVPLDAIGFHAFNLFVLVFLLTWLLRGKIRDALANRTARIKRNIDESNTLRKEAQQRFEELEGRLDGFEGRLDEMKADAERDAGAERETMLARAEEDAARVRESAERTIRDEANRARQVLRQEVAELSVGLARKQLQAEVTADDEKRLADDFIETVKGGKNGVGHG
jgi:F-type H+-transporting ATPase subunit b